jgi:hypothetical protein
MQWVMTKFNNEASFLSLSCNFKVYYLENIEQWQNRIKIVDTATLRESLLLVSEKNFFRPFIVVSIEENSPNKAPCIINSCDTPMSVITNSTCKSNRGSSQDNFHQRVLSRDDSQCVFCNNTITSELEAAHIFEVFRDKDIPNDDKNFLRQYDIIDMYDTNNGITLCRECHRAFDKRLCCVHVEHDENGIAIDHTIIVANALIQNQMNTEKWIELQGKSVRVPTENKLLKYWPTEKLFKYREDKFNEKTDERHQLTEDCSFVCT